MDVHIEDSLNLDEAMARDYDSTDTHAVLEEKQDTTMAQLQRSIKLQSMDSIDELMIDSQNEEMIVDMPDISGPEIPIMDEEEVITTTSQLHTEHIVKMEVATEPETIINDLEIPLEVPPLVPVTPKSVTSHLTHGNRVMTGVKPMAIAPKPVTLMPTKHLTLTGKTGITSLQSAQRSGTLLAVNSNGRQMVIQMANMAPGRSHSLPSRSLVSSGPNGGAKLNLLANSPQQLVLLANDGNTNKTPVRPTTQYITKSQSFSTTKKVVPAIGINQVSGITKVGSQGTATAVTTPKYLTLQQAQQLGLLTNTTNLKVQQVLNVGNKSMQNVQVIRPKSQPVLRSPTKILPAPTPSQAGKIVLPAANKAVVIRPAGSKTGQQIIKASSVGNIKLNASSGLSFVGNATTVLQRGTTLSQRPLQPLQVPGKYVRFVSTNIANTAMASINSTTVPKLKQSPIAPKPTTEATIATLSTSMPQRTLLTVSGGKTMLIPDGFQSYIQMPSNKIQTAVVSSTGPATLKKIVAKPQQKIVPISLSFASTIQKYSHSVTTSPAVITALAPTTTTESALSITAMQPATFQDSVSAENIKMNVSPMQSDDDNNEDDTDEPMNYKATLRPLFNSAEQEENKHQEQDMEIANMEEDADDSRESWNDQGSKEDMRSGEGGNQKTQHVIMLPAAFLQQINSQHSDMKEITDIKEEFLSQVELPSGAKVPFPALENSLELGMRPRKPCNCAKSQCLKLYCDCFANGEFCHQCNCNNCFNNLENEEERQKAIRSCLERNPNAFRPKIGKARSNLGPEAVIRKHTKGCNCKRSGCLKNYCECYEAKIACSNNCKCIGCRNVEETVERARNMNLSTSSLSRPQTNYYGEDGATSRPNSHNLNNSFKVTAAAPPVEAFRQPCSFMTSDVIDAVCQCLLAAAGDDNNERKDSSSDSVQRVLEEFGHCLQDIIKAARHAQQETAA